MSIRACSKCNRVPCMYTWCAGKDQCCQQQMMNKYPAGPYIYTGEDNIGNRPCAENLKKCSAKGRTWCSHNGKCEKMNWTCPSAPFYNYADRLVQENYQFGEKTDNGVGIL